MHCLQFKRFSSIFALSSNDRKWHKNFLNMFVATSTFYYKHQNPAQKTVESLLYKAPKHSWKIDRKSVLMLNTSGLLETSTKIHLFGFKSFSVYPSFSSSIWPRFTRRNISFFIQLRLKSTSDITLRNKTQNSQILNSLSVTLIIPGLPIVQGKTPTKIRIEIVKILKKRLTFEIKNTNSQQQKIHQVCKIYFE